MDFINALINNNRTIAEKALNYAKLNYANTPEIMQEFQSFYDATMTKLTYYEQSILSKNMTLK